MTITLTRGPSSPADVARILGELPEWFGIEQYTREYVEAAHRLPNYLARDRDSTAVVGVVLVEQHFPTSAEIHLMAVSRAFHRNGIGRRLLAFVEDDLRSQGTTVLSLKTLGPSRQDVGYDATRRFYEDVGFIPVEELLNLWPENPCLIMVKPI